MGLFFEKASKQSMFQRVLTNIIITYLIIGFGNSFVFKIEWLRSVMTITDIVLLAIVFIWLAFYASKTKDEK